MESQSTEKDSFYKLMQTQKVEDLPPFLEDKVMRSVEITHHKNKWSSIYLAIFIFGLMASSYILLTLLSSHYLPYSGALTNLKQLLFIGLIVHLIYEANERIPSLLRDHFFHRSTFML